MCWVFDEKELKSAANLQYVLTAGPRHPRSNNFSSIVGLHLNEKYHSFKSYIIRHISSLISPFISQYVENVMKHVASQ